MPTQNRSTVRRRQLGRRLRELRERAGLTIDAAAPVLDWSSSKLSRIENGQQSVDVHGVRSMLDLYDVGGEPWTELLELTRQARERGWWHAYGVSNRGYVPLESEASAVRTFELALVPGLLQTADYTWALFQASIRRRSDEEIERQITVRTIRQQRLTSRDDPIALAAIVDEAALLRPVGGPAVMTAQLQHLIRAAALPTVTFQVLPISAGAHAGMEGGFSVLSFDDLGEPDIAYIEYPGGAAHIAKAADVAVARLRFDRLHSEALNPADSVALVEELVDRTSSSPREGADVHCGFRRRPLAEEQL